MPAESQCAKTTSGDNALTPRQDLLSVVMARFLHYIIDTVFRGNFVEFQSQLCPRGVAFMPTYDYECQVCTYRFEHFQTISAAPLEACPRCGQSVKRLIGGGLGIIFKGSGFYTTDSRSSKTGDKSKPSAKKDESKPTGDTKKNEGDSTPKSDTKAVEKNSGQGSVVLP